MLQARQLHLLVGNSTNVKSFQMPEMCTKCQHLTLESGILPDVGHPLRPHIDFIIMYHSMQETLQTT